MKKPILLAFTLLATAFAESEYKAQTAGPADAAGAFKASLEAQGTRIVDESGKVYAEIWLRAKQPEDAKSTEQNITLPELPPGALMGVVSFPEGAHDRRGQVIKPGVYTLRYSQFPITGDHQGVAPQRDFLVLSAIADDTAGPETNVKFPALMALSRKGSGTSHPIVLSIWKADEPVKLGLAKEGEHDWVLQHKVGTISLSIIIAGRAEG